MLLVDRIDAGEHDGKNERDQIGLGPVHQPDTRRQDHHPDQQHRDIGDQQATIETVDYVGTALEQQRARRQAVDQERAE